MQLQSPDRSSGIPSVGASPREISTAEPVCELVNRPTRQDIAVDGHTEPGLTHRSPAAVAECDILVREQFLQQMTIARSLQITDVRNDGGPMLAGCGENARFPRMAAELITDPCSCACAAMRRLFKKPPHLDKRMLNRSQAASATARSASGRLVNDSSSITGTPSCGRSRLKTSSSSCGRGCSMQLMRNRSSGATARATRPPARLRRRPGEYPLAARARTGCAEPLCIVSSRHTHFHLALVKAVQTHFQGTIGSRRAVSAVIVVE